jgi:hypothetical protein
LRYAITQFLKDYPTDESCLEIIFQQKYKDHVCPCGSSAFYRITGRPAYVCANGHHLHPLKGTIFEKTRTPLTSWFYVTYLFSVSKNGVAATEIQRHLGITYKTAWRMGHKVRHLMRSDNFILDGHVEVDETYIGGRHRRYQDYSKKHAVFGAVERGGRIRAKYVKSTGSRVLLPEIYQSVRPGSHIYSDEWRAYKKLPHYGYGHSTVEHGAREWGRGEVYTNTIEGFWGQMKRSLHGTHHSVSKKWLQSYVDEFVFKYNNRTGVFFRLMERITL